MYRNKAKASDIEGAALAALVEALRSRRSLAEARCLRIRAGLSHQELAAHLGVHRATVGRWERGQSRPLGENGRRYRRALRVLEEAAVS